MSQAISISKSCQALSIHRGHGGASPRAAREQKHLLRRRLSGNATQQVV
jgi:hypothetical protein